MAAAYVQSGSVSSTGTAATTIAKAFGSSVTTGNLICGIVTWGDSTQNVLTSVTDNQGNTYTIQRRVSDVGNSQSAASFFAANVTGGSVTVTANFSPTVGWRGLSIHEASGCATTSPLDVETGQVQTTPGTGANAVTSGAVTTTVNGAYVFGGVATTSAPGDGTSQYVAGTGYTEREEITTSGNQIVCSEDQVQASAASIAATFTQDTNQSAITFILTFKPAAAGGLTVSQKSMATSQTGRTGGFVGRVPR